MLSYFKNKFNFSALSYTSNYIYCTSKNILLLYLTSIFLIWFYILPLWKLNTVAMILKRVMIGEYTKLWCTWKKWEKRQKCFDDRSHMIIINFIQFFFIHELTSANSATLISFLYIYITSVALFASVNF